jgi:hypothetical protein
MNQKATVIFDGEFLRPELPLNLKTNTRYIITIQESEEQVKEKEDAYSLLEKMTGSIEAPADWSINHDYYLYGTSREEFSEKE